MYYPKQIPQLLNETYRKHLTYNEYHVKQLEEYIMCIWQVTSTHTIVTPIVNTVLPDGCIDLVIDLDTRIMVFSGFSKNTETLSLEGNVNYMGVRFKPGAIYSLFNLHGDKVMDSALPFNEVEKEYDLSGIYKTKDTIEQIDILTAYLTPKTEGEKNIEYIRLVDFIYHRPTNQCVRDISARLGYESRQLQRIFLKNYGVSPKVLLNILRLHKCLTLLFDDAHSLQDIALECGFYDQAHFIKEIKRYTGILPTSLLEEYRR